MFNAPDLCQMLWPWHAGHSRLLHPLALAVLCLGTLWAGTCKSGNVGISFPKCLRTQLKRNVSGYVCNPSSSRERDTASRGHTSGIPASASFIPRSWRRFHRTCFYNSWPLRHLVRDVPPSIKTDYTCIQSRSQWWRSLSVSRHSISCPQGTRVTYVNWEVFCVHIFK